MLKKLILPIFCFILIAGCSKDRNDTDASFFRARIDGANREFNLSIVAQKSNGGKTITIVAAGGNMSSAFPAVSLDIEDDAIITSGTYHASGSNVVFGYLSDPLNTYFSGSEFTVSVSSVTDLDIAGTFSGKVSNGAAIINIEEGTFFTRFE